MPRPNPALMHLAYPPLRIERPAWPTRPIGAGLDPAAGEQYTGAAAIGGTVGELGHIQLLNPGDAQRELIIEALAVSTATAELFSLTRHNTPLTTFIDRWRSGGQRGAQGLGQLRRQTNASKLGVEIYRIHVPANTPLHLDRLRILLAPGEGLVAVCETANASASASFVGRELPR